MLFTIILAYLIGFAEILSFILSICPLVTIKKQQKKDQKSSGAGWIIWFIVTLAILLPKLWDFLADWIGTNL